MGLLGVLARIAKSTALMKEIPALIQTDLQPLQPLSLSLAQLAAGFLLPQFVLLVGELIDPVDHLFVLHRLHLLVVRNKRRESENGPPGRRLAELAVGFEPTT
jgi:hypothetical protein